IGQEVEYEIRLLVSGSHPHQTVPSTRSLRDSPKTTNSNPHGTVGGGSPAPNNSASVTCRSNSRTRRCTSAIGSFTGQTLVKQQPTPGSSRVHSARWNGSSSA